jgi:F0F1-type ATP synthase membrane subunit b/b'
VAHDFYSGVTQGDFMISNTDTLASSLSASIADGADRLATKADGALQDTQRLTNQAAHKINEGVDGLRAKTSGALSHAAAQAEELTRRGVARAREVTAQARDRASQVRDLTADRVQADPMKALLITAAAGAAAALVLQWLSHSRHHD